MTTTLFTICNTGILFFWLLLLFFPKKKFTQAVMAYPWVPAVLALFYGYFLFSSGGLEEADFTSLEGVTQLFKNATPASVAAGWIHYLAFDFWVGCTLLLWSQKQGIPHLVVVFPLICTFMLGPLGVLLFVIFTRAYRALKPKA